LTQDDSIGRSDLSGDDDAVRPTALRASKKTVPDFFIVGHPKCGTTALYEMLRRHPQIYMPELKEPQFFATEERYRFRPQKSLDDYLSLFDPAKADQRVGEASVLYLWSHTAAGRIADLQPAAQIIAILREPASFLRSLHLQFVQTHLEMEKDFRKAISLEDLRRAGQHDHRSLASSPQMLLYAGYVRYVDQLRRYYTQFPPGRVLVLIYDDLRHDNDAVVRTVFSFLGVDDTFPIYPVNANPTVRVRSQRLNNLIRAVYRGEGPVSRLVKIGVKALMPSRQLRLNALRGTQRHVLYGDPRPPDEELMAELRRRFKPEVVALSEYLDRDLVTLWGYDSIG
jgi:Sulfotransferase domain